MKGWSIIAAAVVSTSAASVVAQHADDVPHGELVAQRSRSPEKDSFMTLEEFMKQRLNKALTRASYVVFQQQMDGDSRELQQATQDLLSTTTGLRAFQANFQHDAPAFHNHVVSLQIGVRAFNEAAVQGDRAAAAHWMDHIRATCNSCHLEFRD